MRVFNLAEELEKERKKNKELEDKIYYTSKYLENIIDQFEELPDKRLITNRMVDIKVIYKILDMLKGE